MNILLYISLSPLLPIYPPLPTVFSSTLTGEPKRAITTFLHPIRSSTSRADLSVPSFCAVTAATVAVATVGTPFCLSTCYGAPPIRPSFVHSNSCCYSDSFSNFRCSCVRGPFRVMRLRCCDRIGPDSYHNS